MGKKLRHRADNGGGIEVTRAGDQISLRPTPQVRHQLSKEIGCSQRNFNPILALCGARREFASIVSQPKTPRTVLQDHRSVRADHWVGQGAATQFFWSSIIVDEFTPLAIPVNGQRLKIGMRP
jgi:hypothetical protein